MVTNDVKVINNLLRLKVNLFKEVLEGLGEDLGRTKINAEYENYLGLDPIEFNKNAEISDFNFDPHIENYKDYASPENIGNLNAYVSKHFKLKDLCRTSKCPLHKNVPNHYHNEYLIKLANEIIEPIYDMMGGRIHINSCYRSKEVNRLVNGSPTSQHTIGQAVDISATSGVSNATLYKMIFNLIKQGKLKVGQLIWEGGTMSNPAWVHVSLPYRRVNHILAAAPTRNIDVILANNGLQKSSNMV